MNIRLLKKQMTAAYQYSYVRLVLNYYTLFETIGEEPGISESISECCRRLNELLGNHFSGVDCLEDLLKLREAITGEVEIMTSYTDCFQNYEYVLNRLERKFKSLPDSKSDDSAFAEKLLSFITGSDETVVMNGRIKDVVGQLPVRLTKQKFFSLIAEGLSVYIGSSPESFQDMMYTLRSVSMTSLPNDMKKGHEEFYSLLEQFRCMDYKNLTGEQFDSAMAGLKSVSEKLIAESGLYVMLQEIVNDFCVLLFSGKEAVIDVNEEEFYQSMITEVLGKFQKEDYSFGDDSFFEKLTQLEGRQESYYERYLKVEVPQEEEEWGTDPDYIKSVNIDRLLSGSSFAELKTFKTEIVSEKEESLVDRFYLEKETGIYIKELEQFFSGTSKQVTRAVMAKVLSCLPVYFNSIDEIQAYIRGSLTSCLDEAEKETCKELLEELMDYENMLV